MKLTQFCNVCAIFVCILVGENAETLDIKYAIKKTKCLNPPRTAHRFRSVIEECNEEVSTKLVNESLKMMREVGAAPAEKEEDQMRLMHRIRRVGTLSSDIYNSTVVPFADKHIGGCLVHCVYAKNNAIDARGWPTVDGLVNFYSKGVNEQGFFMATLRAVNLCLRALTHKYKVNRRQLSEDDAGCVLAYDVSDCISDQITSYCMYQYRL